MQSETSGGEKMMNREKGFPLSDANFELATFGV